MMVQGELVAEIGGWRSNAGGIEGRFPSITPDPTVPFKALATRRHHMSKQQHRIMKWAEYDAALRERGT